MPIAASAWVTENPSFTEPELILPVAQASGAFDLIEGGAPRARLSEGTLLVYMKRVDLRTQMSAGTAGYNQLPGITITLSQLSAPTYLLRVRAEYDAQDEAAAGQWGLSLPQAYRLGMRQGHFQLMRSLLLYGANPQAGEGLVNTAGATAVNLPPDTYGMDTVVTYDNGQMAFFILQQIELLKTRTNQLGIGQEFTICGPQRVLGAFQYQNIVQLVQYQRVGAGSASTANLVREVLESNGDKIKWTYDDTLIGKGQGGTDLVIISMPALESPKADGSIDTNEFGNQMGPKNNVLSTMYTDMIAPREIVSPLPLGATDVVSQQRVTSGWGVRPEGLVLISMQYQ